MQSNSIFIDKELITKVIIDCRTTASQTFRTILGFKQHNVILTKEQSVLMNHKSSFEAEICETRYSVLGYRIDLDFSNHKLPIEIDENDHSHRNIDYEIKRQKAVEKELGCKYIRIAQIC